MCACACIWVGVSLYSHCVLRTCIFFFLSQPFGRVILKPVINLSVRVISICELPTRMLYDYVNSIHECAVFGFEEVVYEFRRLPSTYTRLTWYACVYAYVVTPYGFRSHNKLIYDWPHANTCINFHAKFMCVYVRAYYCVCLYMFAWFFLLRYVAIPATNMPECVKYMRPVNVVDLCHIHIKSIS